MYIKRDLYLEKLINRIDNKMIKVITGIRRSGKSFLLNEIFYNYLIENGIKDSSIIRFSFEDPECLNLLNININEFYKFKKIDADKFLNYINSKINNNEKYYLLLDEVQNLNSFELVLNGFLYKNNLDVYVTGSNSKFLSSDIITEFRGRGDEIHVLPLSFNEIYNSFKDKNINLLYEEYLLYGGLPQIFNLKTEEQKINYLNSQVKNVYLKDLIERYNIKNVDTLNETIEILSSSISSLINPSKISNTFKSLKNVNINPEIINNYINNMEEAFILKKVKKYDIKGRKYINTPFKIYFEDIGIRNSILNFRQTEKTHLMENIIYNELRYRDYNVDVGIINTREKLDQNKLERKQLEVDFVCNKGSNKIYIQSAFNIDNIDKLNQEIKSLNLINDSFKKIVIVNDSIIKRKNENGILFIGIKEFLLDPLSINY